MNKIIIILQLLVTLSVKAEIPWKPEAISYELKLAHKLLGIGLILELNQVLEPGETGWKQSRIDVPESWSGAKLEMKQGTIYITMGTQTYYVNSTNMGDLSFAILDGGVKTNAELQLIWTKYAKRK